MKTCGACMNYSYQMKCMLSGEQMASGLIAESCTFYNKQFHSCMDCKHYKQSVCSNVKVNAQMIRNKLCSHWMQKKTAVIK